MSQVQKNDPRTIFGWAMYDWPQVVYGPQYGTLFSMSTRAAIYARLSRNRYGEKSATIEYQKEHGAEIAADEAWSVIHMLEDNDLTGTKHANRAGYQQLKRLVETKGIDVIITQDTDRLWRDDRESGPFRDLCAENEIDIRTWQRMEPRTDDPDAYQDLAHRDVTSAAYAKQISKKVKDAHRRRLKEGRVNGGGRMFGERSPEEAEVVRALAGRVLAGESLNSMSRWLNDNDHETTRGNPWAATTLKKLLVNPRLAGWLYTKGERVGRITDYQPILDDETFEKVRVVLTSPIFKPNRGKPSRLLTPFLRCSKCGGSMKGSSNGQRKTYTCRSDRPCSRRMTVTADLADNAVVKRVLVRMEAIRGLAELIEVEAGLQASGILAQLETIEERKRRAYTSYVDDVTTQEEFYEQRARLEVEETELRDELVPMVLDPGDEQPRQVWEKSSYQQRKAILALNVESILVMPPITQSRKGFNPKRLVIRWKTSQVEDRMRKGRLVLRLDVGDISEAEAERIMQAGLGFLAEHGFDAKGKLEDSDGARGMTEELKQALAGYIATILEGSEETELT